VEMLAHDDLRDAIKCSTLAMWDRIIADPETNDEARANRVTARPEVEAGVLVDYVVAAVFDSGSDDHDVSVILRTDGRCSRYRTLGLLSMAIEDL
jgi:hypothetical protein